MLTRWKSHLCQYMYNLLIAESGNLWVQSIVPASVLLKDGVFKFDALSSCFS
ncbi:hypothetical protein BY458DRAFT_521763 [Sporodiniella umbellata]|nr:hypothetical protein BY458DRAFT_521763 [Sporodiniella umbellata]